MEDDLKENITAKETWLRGLFILIFAFLLAVARVVMWATVLFQFLVTLFAGKVNEKLLSFSSSLCRFVYQCFLYVTYNANEKPFPFGEWPSGDEDEDKTESKKRVAKKSAKKKAVAKKVEPENATEAPTADAAAESTEPSDSDSSQGADTSEKPES